MAKRKPPKKGGLKVPDLRVMEPVLADLKKAFGGTETSRRGRGKTAALEEAQQVIYVAWETGNRVKRVDLAEEAVWALFGLTHDSLSVMFLAISARNIAMTVFVVKGARWCLKIIWGISGGVWG